MIVWNISIVIFYKNQPNPREEWIRLITKLKILPDNTQRNYSIRN